ncbi:MAG TPA: deoxyribonuclease IV [Candidatus Aphodovivens avicola]|nr:deoxyribonuclease IV [Candidatus Aphodovivens avicola]
MGLTIGCHLSIAKGYRAIAEEAVSLGANTFQFFTRNPRGGKAKAIDPADVASFRAYAAEQGIERILAHAPYTLNPASATEKTRDFARMALAEDLARMENTPGQLYNMHPGSHVGQGVDVGIDLIAAALDEALRSEQTTTLLLETMAGKGSEIGGRFEELAAIIERVGLRDKVGVCLDTCHVWDAGYDIAGDLDGVLREFDEVVGFDRLRAVHLNDSLNPRGARKDRHARIGEGFIGFEALSAVTRHPLLRDLPFYLETPQEELSGYADEIARLRAAWEG